MSAICGKLFLYALAALALVACGGHNDPVPLVFHADLGARETGLSGGSTFATGIVTVDEDRRTLIASVVPTGVAATGVRIEAMTETVPGRAAQVVATLAPEADGGLWTTTQPISIGQLIALRKGNYYFVIADTTFPAGVIRGRIVEQFPSWEQLARLDAFRDRSWLARRQLEQIQDIEEADWNFTGIGLTIGF